MPGRKPSAKDLERFSEVLLHMRNLVAGDIGLLEEDAFGIEDGTKAAVDNRFDGGSDSFHQEFSLELLARDASTLAEIDAALERVADGSFGRCKDCEIWIPRPRLRTVPHVRRCIDCQRAAEANA